MNIKATKSILKYGVLKNLYLRFTDKKKIKNKTSKLSLGKFKKI